MKTMAGWHESKKGLTEYLYSQSWYIEVCREKKPWNHGPSKKVKSARKRSKASRRKNRKK